MRFWLIALTVLVFVALFRLMSSNGGIAEYLSLNQRLTDLEQLVRQQREINQLLSHEVRDLQQGTVAIETIARQQLGMIGQDEVFIKLLELKPSNIPAPKPNEAELPLIQENPQPINKVED